MVHSKTRLERISKARLMLTLLWLLTVLKAENPKLYKEAEAKAGLTRRSRKRHHSRKHGRKSRKRSRKKKDPAGHRFTAKEHRQHDHIQRSLMKEGYSLGEANKRAWATVVSRQ